MTSNLRSLHWWALTELQRALLLDAEDNGGSLTFGQAGEQLRGSIRRLTELGLVTSTSTATGNGVTVRLNPVPDQSEVDNDAIEAAQPNPGPLELAGRLMAVVTDAWLHAPDRTLAQLHDEACALLTLAQRQQ